MKIISNPYGHTYSAYMQFKFFATDLKLMKEPEITYMAIPSQKYFYLEPEIDSNVVV